MSSAFNVGVNGMLAFQRGLDIISSNISNVNTPGYRRQIPFFRSLGGDALGASLKGAGSGNTPGQPQQTGNPLDLALNGGGFFTLRNKETGELFYTRAGNFELVDGGLVDRVTGFQVMGVSEDGTLKPVSVATKLTRPPIATTKVKVSGTLARNGSTEPTGETPKAVLPNITVYDAKGNKHTLKVEVELSTGQDHSWFVHITDERGASLTAGLATIGFDSEGYPDLNSNTVTAQLTVGDTVQSIVFDFGTPHKAGGTRQVTSGGNSTLELGSVDGHAILGLQSTTVDENGVLKLSYGNGEKDVGDDDLAIAWFGDESALEQRDGGLFRTNGVNPARYGRANQDLFGAIRSGVLEGSGSDLVTEMGEILTIQRGFQACSRVMTVADEMVRSVLDGTRNS